MPMVATPPIVHVIDDDPSVLRMLEQLIVGRGWQCAVHEHAQTFLRDYDPTQHGALVLDAILPETPGLELLEHIRAQGWSIPVVFITGKPHVDMAVQAMKLGSIEFLEKPFDMEAMEAVLVRAIEQDRAQRASVVKRATIAERVATLSPRERQVMDLVVAGRSNRLIAEEFGVSPKTVEAHRAKVMEKMQAESLAELVRMVVALQDDITDGL